MAKGFLFDASRCVGCFACVVACKDHNDLQDGAENWRSVERFEYGTYPDIFTISISISCLHCTVPICVEVCPVKAIQRRVEDHLVVVNSDQCIGCKSCLMVCPFGAPKIAKDGKMHKCDYCLSRRIPDAEPACARVCPFGALHAGPVEELQKISVRGAARKLVMAMEVSGLVGKR